MPVAMTEVGYGGGTRMIGTKAVVGSQYGDVGCGHFKRGIGGKEGEGGGEHRVYL